MPAIIARLNWIDVFFLILLLGMAYKGTKTGVGGQIVSLIGSFVLVFCSIRYYEVLAEAIFGFMLQTWARPISFFAIAIIIFVLGKVLERAFNLSGGENLVAVERLGGIVIASLRAFVFFGMIGLLFLLVPVERIRFSVVEGSKTCMFFVNMDTEIYSWMTEVLKETEKKHKDKNAVLEQFLSAVETEKESK